MVINKSGITAHMIVKNEDQWVYFAIMSVLPYVDQFLITDTGSSDNTINIIESIASEKIIFTQLHSATPSDLTAIREKQLALTQTDWVWIVDGDEIYPRRLADEIVAATGSDKPIILVRRYDLLGDIYHRQNESVGTYELFGKRGHLLIRLVNKSFFRNLHYQGDYPNEGFMTEKATSILNCSNDQVYTSKHALYHAMYLTRSSLGNNLSYVTNRSKFKVEKGIPVKDNPPEVFFCTRPPFVPDPLKKRSLGYELLASMITPIKNLVRKLR